MTLLLEVNKHEVIHQIPSWNPKQLFIFFLFQMDDPKSIHRKCCHLSLFLLFFFFLLLCLLFAVAVVVVVVVVVIVMVVMVNRLVSFTRPGAVPFVWVLSRIQFGVRNLETVLTFMSRPLANL